jgi:hypothetical protein
LVISGAWAGTMFQSEEFSRLDGQLLVPDLYVGHVGGAEVAEPVAVRGAGTSAPDDETVWGLEVAHAGGARRAGASAGCGDDQARWSVSRRGGRGSGVAKRYAGEWTGGNRATPQDRRR